MTHTHTAPVAMTVHRIEAHARHIAKVLAFDAHQAPYIDYNRIAQQARELGAGFDVHYAQHGAATITMFWPLTDAEAADMEQREAK